MDHGAQVHGGDRYEMERGSEVETESGRDGGRENEIADYIYDTATTMCRSECGIDIFQEHHTS